MQELIDKLVTKAGLTLEQATHSVQVMLEHVKTKLPPAFTANIEDLFSGNHTVEPKMSWHERAEDLAEHAKEKFEEISTEAKEKMGEVADKAEEMAKESLEKLKSILGHKEN
jgi:polyhydroxyalkanoate synthesis regulator phasin